MNVVFKVNDETREKMIKYYEENGYNVIVIKSVVDTKDLENLIYKRY